MNTERADLDSMTPAELRKEADRRELVDRSRRLADRRWARNQVVEAVLAIDRDLVKQADAGRLFRALVAAVVAAEEGENHVTNGDVSMVSFGVPLNWWQDATADHPKLTDEAALERVRHGRGLPW